MRCSVIFLSFFFVHFIINIFVEGRLWPYIACCTDFQTPAIIFFFCVISTHTHPDINTFKNKKETFINLKQSIENIYPRKHIPNIKLILPIHNNAHVYACFMYVVVVVVGRFDSSEFIIIIYFICQVSCIQN